MPISGAERLFDPTFTTYGEPIRYRSAPHWDHGTIQFRTLGSRRTQPRFTVLAISS